jgi:rod shape-determining protein MreD
MVFFAALILFQTLLLNRINLFGIVTPVMYVYFLLKLSIGRNRYYVITSAFAMGMILDIFLNTPGMNAAAITIVAAFRKSISRLFFERVDYDDFVPGVNTATGPFVRFTVFMVILHLTLLFFIESFTLFNLKNTLLRIVTSSAVTIPLIIALDSLMFRRTRGEQ